MVNRDITLSVPLLSQCDKQVHYC